jgi:cobyrinic acid a,c-diamide synthase
MNIPRLMIAGTQSGSGKTTLSTAVMAALTARGVIVQPFKVGPDYIDPGYHTAATGRASRNLDAWFLGESGVREVFQHASAGAGLCLIEGVMGLYDGRGAGDEGSSAQVARILDCPVVLVLDARSMARSAAAVILGFKNMDPRVNLAGVILNRVGSQRHFELLKDAVGEVCGIPVLGGVMHSPGAGVPERHLGLLPVTEKKQLAGYLASLAHEVAGQLDLDLLLKVAAAAPGFLEEEPQIFPREPAPPLVRLGLIQDEAFSFYYRDGLDLLEALGAELVTCSALRDGQLPPGLHGLYIGGGFPEMFLPELSANRPFMDSVIRLARGGAPVYAECGGLIYLSRAAGDLEGREYPLVGLVPGRCRMEQRRVALGYVEALALADNILVPAGTVLRGHEFHYSSLEPEGEPSPAYMLSKLGGAGRPDGYVRGNLLASYLHLHLAGHPGAARGLIHSCLRYKEQNSAPSES